jgi:pyruvate,orthophosphate dikinase
MTIVRIGADSTKHHSPESIGAKAASLVKMSVLGLPVPHGFVLPIKLCAAIVEGDAHAERQLADGLREGVGFLEEATGKRLGDRHRPLLLSVRSGAARSLPGMLDTVLNVGCTLDATRGLIRMTGNPRFAWDCRRRFLEGYAQTVLGIDPGVFTADLGKMITDEQAGNDRDLDSEALERLAAGYLVLIDDAGFGLPDDPMKQLTEAARAVYRSWTSERARTYRQLEHLESLEGTAVTVQAMVFGNRGLSSGAGVAFSRDPSIGTKEPVIDVLFDAQGEDVVSGRRTPDGEAAITRSLPSAASELREILVRLEKEFGDVQDIEFTIEDGKLWILQTRSAKRTPRAALRIAIDLVHEGLLTAQEALRRLNGVDLKGLTQTRLATPTTPIARGVGASAGIAVGRAAFDLHGAERLKSQDDPVILLRPETSTADVAGFAAAAGIVTTIGGRTAHAALVARQMGKPCIVGCSDLLVDVAARQARIGNAVLKEGDWLAINGDDGAIYAGRLATIVERPDAELREIESWRTALKHRKPSVTSGLSA